MRQCCNAFIEYTTTFAEEYIRSKNNQNLMQKLWILDIIITIVAVVIGLEIVAASAHHAWFPHDQTYPGSIIAEEDLTLPIYIGFVVAYSCSQIIVCTLIGLHFLVVSSYMFVVTMIILPEFILGRKTGYNTRTCLRTFQKLPHSYRSLQLLHGAAMQLYGPMLVPFQTLCTNQILFCNFILCTRWEETEILHRVILIFWSVFTMLGWGEVLKFSGALYLDGQRTLTSWKHWKWGTRRENRYMKRFGRAAKPIRVHDGTCYTIRKLTVLKFFRGIVRGTFRMILIEK
ncbi:unnamed protein product [Orchesella dallaii]|uniref:Uncharacterized protein n=1 Tax=Orchesella dallaii TaxID=48710 RepID=A0ABP1S739_9HEXA